MVRDHPYGCLPIGDDHTPLRRERHFANLRGFGSGDPRRFRFQDRDREPERMAFEPPKIVGDVTTDASNS
jgi:hypothetical protein